VALIGLLLVGTFTAVLLVDLVLKAPAYLDPVHPMYAVTLTLLVLYMSCILALGGAMAWPGRPRGRDSRGMRILSSVTLLLLKVVPVMYFIALLVLPPAADGLVTEPIGCDCAPPRPGEVCERAVPLTCSPGLAWSLPHEATSVDECGVGIEHFRTFRRSLAAPNTTTIGLRCTAREGTAESDETWEVLTAVVREPGTSCPAVTEAAPCDADDGSGVRYAVPCNGVTVNIEVPAPLVNVDLSTGGKLDVVGLTADLDLYLTVDRCPEALPPPSVLTGPPCSVGLDRDSDLVASLARSDGIVLRAYRDDECQNRPNFSCDEVSLGWSGNTCVGMRAGSVMPSLCVVNGTTNADGQRVGQCSNYADADRFYCSAAIGSTIPLASCAADQCHLADTCQPGHALEPDSTMCSTGPRNPDTLECIDEQIVPEQPPAAHCTACSVEAVDDCPSTRWLFDESDARYRCDQAYRSVFTYLGFIETHGLLPAAPILAILLGIMFFLASMLLVATVAYVTM
jgi:hypothetical protein